MLDIRKNPVKLLVLHHKIDFYTKRGGSDLRKELIKIKAHIGYEDDN